MFLPDFSQSVLIIRREAAKKMVQTTIPNRENVLLVIITSLYRSLLDAPR